MRMDFLSIFLGDFRGPRETFFLSENHALKKWSNHGALLLKCTNFEGLVLIPKTDKLLLSHLKRKGKT